MTAPSEIPSRRPPARPATRRRDALELETLRGPARLERSPHGHLELQPRPTPEALATYYREAFYQQDHASYLSDKQAQRDYWDAIWSIRRELMEAVLAPTARRLLDVGCGGGFLLVMAPPETHESIREALGRPKELEFRSSRHGSRIAFVSERH